MIGWLNMFCDWLIKPVLWLVNWSCYMIGWLNMFCDWLIKTVLWLVDWSCSVIGCDARRMRRQWGVCSLRVRTVRRWSLSWGRSLGGITWRNGSRINWRIWNRSCRKKSTTSETRSQCSWHVSSIIVSISTKSVSGVFLPPQLSARFWGHLVFHSCTISVLTL